MELCISDIEEVPRPYDLLRGYTHQSDLGWVAANFWSPETEQLLVCLDRISLRKCWRPLEVRHALDLDSFFVQLRHLW